MLLVGRTDAPCCIWVALPPQLSYRKECTVITAHLTRGFSSALCVPVMTIRRDSRTNFTTRGESS